MASAGLSLPHGVGGVRDRAWARIRIRSSGALQVLLSVVPHHVYITNGN